MKLTALMAARNESWILGLSMRAALMYCDEVVVLNHASTDTTGGIIIDVAEGHPGRVCLLHEDSPTWNEMNHRQRMLDVARSRRATHLAYIDADEVLTGNLLPFVRSQIATLPNGGFLQVGMPCIWRGFDKWRDDTSVFGRALTMLAFKDSGGLGWRPKADGYQFHSREPHGARMAGRIARECGGQMHLQFASWRRLIAKHALYKMQETIRWPGRKTAKQIDDLYSMAPNETGAILADTPGDWWEAYDHLLQYADLDQKPWQEDECKRLWKEYGPEVFKGLNLFGIVEQKETVNA